MLRVVGCNVVSCPLRELHGRAVGITHGIPVTRTISAANGNAHTLSVRGTHSTADG